MFIPKMNKKKIAMLTFSHNSIGSKTGGGTPPQPSTRDKSLPVPIGKMHTSGIG